MNSTVKTPWYSSYGDVKPKLEYTTLSMCNEFAKVAKENPTLIAYEFMGKSTTYANAIKDVEKCARSLKEIGVKKGDKVTVCLPNCPQAISMFYAINMIGAIGNMIHPLSGEAEIAFYLNDSKSVCAITLDQFYSKFESIRDSVNLKHLIISSVKDALSPIMKVGYALTEGKKVPKIPQNADIIYYNDFLKKGVNYKGEIKETVLANDPAVVLYSGGTTGVNKGILLTNLNFNALGAQLAEMSGCFEKGRVMLAAMPIFHGFGLGVSIHAMLINGAKCLLVPRFTPTSYAKIIKKRKPNFISGVPTLYEALLRSPILDGVDLSSLVGVFSGGDTLSIDLKRRMDKFLADHNAKVRVREGYGTTECVTASCLTPIEKEKEGSIGIPLPDMYYKIVKHNTEEELPYGEEGEICIAGPTVMVEYINHKEETEETRRTHSDGMTWIHTGDLGYMDQEGFIYFRQRIKRMIVTSGYNVYPSNIENVLDSHKDVNMSCVIGVADSYKMKKIKAFVMLNEGVKATDDVKKELLAHCKTNVAKYAMPYDIEFREQLPKTLVGKVAYRVLEEEESGLKQA